MEDAVALKPEEEARKMIDALIEKTNWLVQDHENLSLDIGIDVRR